ncbi:MAG: hypothetical protein WCJ76_09335, partial [Comamonadaceae bacterium]
VVDYSYVSGTSGARKTELNVATGPSSTLKLSMDGAKGNLLQASGNLTLEVFGFFAVKGNLALEKSTQQVTLGDAVIAADGTVTKPASQVSVDMLAIGGSNLSAFAGIGGGYEADGTLKSGAIGLSLSGVEFGLALAAEQRTGLEAAGYVLRKWTSLQATAGGAAFVGVDGLTIAADTLSVEINRAATDATLVDYKAQALEINTGTSAEPSSLSLSLDAGEGVLTRATGNLEIDVFGLVQVAGGFGLEKKSGAVTLADVASTTGVDESLTPVNVDMLLIGGSELDAFVGVGSIGLQLSQVNLGLALLSEQLTPEQVTAAVVARKWTTLQAQVGSADFVGVEGLSVGVDSLNLAVNRQATDGSVVDYSLKTGSSTERKTELTVLSGPASSLTLSIDGARGQYTQALGNLRLDVFGFVQVEGEFAIEKASAPVDLRLSDASTASAEVLRIGAHDLNAFAGVGGGTASAIGLQLAGVDFGLALMSEVPAAGVLTAARSWTSLQASAASAALIGVEGLTVRAQDIKIEVNRASTLGGAVVDYSFVSGTSGARKTALTIATGISSTLELSMDGSQGRLLRASASMQIDAFGFLQISGGFALEKRSQSFLLNDGVASADPTKAKAATEIQTDLLTIGGSGLDAFAGVNGASANALGLSLQQVDFGLALMTEVLAKDAPAGSVARKFSTLKATAGSIGFVGLEGFSASASDLSVEINRGVAGSGGAADVVIDHSARQLDVLAGPDISVTLDSDGALGQLTRASGNLEINVFNFVTLSGFLALEKSSRTVKLQAVGAAPAEEVSVDALTLGGKDVGAFVGLNGGTAEAKGLQLSGTEFGLALLSDKADATRTWTSLEATANALSFVGIEGLTASAKDLRVAVNQAGKAGDAVVNYAGTDATSLSIKTGAASSLSLSLKGSEGEVIKAAGNLDIDLFGFFSVKGGFAVEQRSQDVTLSDGSVIKGAELITIGASNVDAFAGVNGSYDATTGLLSGDAMGLSLGGVNFGLALIGDPKDTTRSFTSLQASATSASVEGITGLTVKVQDLLVNINQGITVAAEPARTIKVNTELKLDIAPELVGTLSLNRAAGTGYAASSASVTLGQDISNDALLAALKSGFESLDGIGAGNVKISGNRYDGFVVEFIAALSGVDIADITASAQVASVSYTVGSPQAANAGVNEVKQVTLQALRDAPAPVTVTVGTQTQGLASVNESNEVIFTSPGTAGNYSVFLVADGLVAQSTAGVAGVSEVQRLSITGDTTATASAPTTSVSAVSEGSSAALLNEGYQITFKQKFGFQGFKLYFVDDGKLSVTWTYRNNAENSTDTISQLKNAYAALLNGYLGKTVTAADITVTLDTKYSDSGNRYNVSFGGSLAGVDVKAIGMRSETGTFSNVNTQQGLSGQSEVQRVEVKSTSAGSFTLTLNNGANSYTTDGIAYGSSAATVRYALNAVLGSAGSVEVTSPAKGEYLITFTGALSGTNLSNLVVGTTQSAPSGSFTLSFGGQTTNNISYSGDGATLARRVQTALATLSNIGSGNVTVSYNAEQSNTGLLGLDIRFSGTLANSNTSQITFNQASLGNASASVRTITPGVANVNQVQQISLGTDAQAKGYRLTLTYLGQSYSTALIAGNANQAQIQAAVDAGLGQIAGAQFGVTLSGTQISLSAGGSLAGQNLNLVNLQAEGASASAAPVAGVFVVGNTAQNAANLKTAYATLLGTAEANISVVYDSSYRGGQRYVVSFIGALAGTDIADKGISVSGTQVAYKLLSDGVAATTEVQSLTVDRESTTHGVFRLSFSNAGKTYTTADIDLGASAAALQTALRAAKASDNSTLGALGTINVSGTADAYSVSFGGALSGSDVSELKVAALQVDPQLPSGSFQISLDGIKSADIAYSTDNTVLAHNIQVALEGLAAIGAGNVTVTVDAANTAGRRAAFLLSFGNTLAHVDVANITSHYAGLSLGVVSPLNITQGQAQSGELQSIVIDSAASDVAFTLALTHNSQSATSATIDSGMTQDEVQAKLDAMMSALNTAIGGGFAASATVELWSGTELQVRFGGSLIGVDVAALVCTNVARSYSASIGSQQVGSTTEIAAKPERTLVVDYSYVSGTSGARKTELSVATGPSSTFQLSMDGAKGNLLQASGNLTLDVFGFFAVKGNLALEKSTQQVTLGDAEIAADGTVTKPASQVSVDMLAIGGSNLSAFAGIGGGYETDGTLKSGAIGLSLSGVEFGLALAGEQRTGLEAAGYVLRKWTS